MNSSDRTKLPRNEAKQVVTGGFGMLGSNLVSKMAGDGYQVVVIDNDFRGMKKHALALWDEHGVTDRIRLIEADIREVAMTPDQHPDLDGAGCLIHLADVVAGIGYVFGNQYKILHENIEIDRAAFELASALQVSKLIYASTACAFNQTKQRSLDSRISIKSDLYPAYPESTYGWAKTVGDISLENLAPDLGIAKTTIFFHNLIGTPCDFWSEKSQFLPAISKRAVDVLQEESPSLTVWGSGKQGRALVPVPLAVAAIEHAVRNPSRYYHVGPEFCTSVLEVAQLVTRNLGRDYLIEFDTTKPEGDIGRSVDPDEECKVPGMEISQQDVEAAIGETVKWISDRS
ncbi:NAD-dependent epimerase/dehydratase family protein [Primorskyibacter sp. S87]|uniref:NAD-dependent epimerase/dehydratase family protein n=1 Tax=Primorskyibacter sp. S87 TaxID=3415126 RepID=UPI003C7C8BBA